MAERITTLHGPMYIETCCNCHKPFAMSEPTYKLAKAKGERTQFFCPDGHPQHYILGETEEQKLRRERDQLKQNQAYLDDALRQAQKDADTERRKAAAARGQVTKFKKRAAAGVCPCCNRTFSDLARHMAGQHPGFLDQKDEAANVH